MNRKLLATISICAICLLIFPFQSIVAETSNKLVFNANGGYFSNKLEEIQIDKNSIGEFLRTEIPTKDGEVFGGWLSDLKGDGFFINKENANEISEAYAWWVPQYKAELYTVKIAWISSSATMPKNLNYTYVFEEKNTSAKYILDISDENDLNPQKEIYEYKASILLPKFTPQGDLTQYSIDQSNSYGDFSRDNIYFSTSTQETDIRGNTTNNKTYFNRSRVFKRAINPNLEIVFDDIKPRDVKISLQINTTIAGEKSTSKLNRVIVDNNNKISVNLSELFKKDSQYFQNFIIDDFNNKMKLTGINEFILKAETFKDTTTTLNGNMEEGWVLTYTKP